MTSVVDAPRATDQTSTIVITPYGRFSATICSRYRHGGAPSATFLCGRLGDMHLYARVARLRLHTQRRLGVLVSQAIARTMPKSRRGRRTMTVCGVVACGLALLAEGRRPPPPGPYDAIIVAGCRVQEDGSPSPALARRARRAVELYQQGYARRVVFTGGIGTYGPSEASVAAGHAIAQGLPADAAILEERSTSTAENARFAADLIGRDQRVLVVTSGYHVFRARRVFGRVFRQAEGAGVEAPGNALRWAVPREVFAVAIYAVRGDL